MQIVSWTTVVLFLAIALWLAHICRQQQRRLKKQQAALQNTNQQHQQLKDETQHKAREQEATEERLRSYLHLLDTLINTIPNPIYFKNAAGIFQGCNKVFAQKILGLTRDRIIGRRAQDLPANIPPDLAAVYQRQEMLMNQKAGFHSFEAEVQCADGLRRQFLFSMAPFRDNNNALDGCVAVLSDLTEKNRAAQDRLQKEKLQGVLETAGAVCHEMNQPLQALSGYVEILALSLGGQAGTQDHLARIGQQIERMRQITDKLQGVTRYETTNYAGNTRIIDIHKASE